jgi:hypothetical protein
METALEDVIPLRGEASVSQGSKATTKERTKRREISKVPDEKEPALRGSQQAFQETPVASG